MPGLNVAHVSRMFSPPKFWALELPILLAGSALSTPASRAQQPATSYRQTVLAIQQEIQANRSDDARALLTAAFRQYPSDGGLENLLGILEIQQGHAGAAKRAFSDAILHSPKLTSAYLNLARIDMQSADADSGDRAHALHLYDKVLGMEPDNAEANYEEAVILMEDRKFEASLQRLQRLDAESQKQLRVEALLCEDNLALRRNDAANRATAAMAASTDITEQDAMSMLPALRTARRADLVDALFSAANERQPLSTAGLRILGLAEEAEGEPDKARATLESVFAMDPTQANPLVDLTRIALAQKDYQGALGYLAHARVLQPNDPSLPYEFGVICLKMSLLGEATRAMGEAVRLSPNNPEYNFGLGTLSSFAQDPSLAFPYLNKYHELRPADPAGVLALGTAYFRNKDFDHASVWLKRAADSPATAAQARYYLGRVLREQGQYDQAIAQLTESDRLKPDQPEVLAELGQVYLQTRNYPEAEKELNRTISLDPDSYAGNFGLLQLYAYNHDPRREEQAKRFQTIRGRNEEDYREAMRVIEIRPQAGAAEKP